MDKTPEMEFYGIQYLVRSSTLNKITSGCVCSVICAVAVKAHQATANENCVLLGYYAVTGCNSLPIGPIYKVPESWLDSCPLKMGTIICPETSVRNYHYSLPNSPEQPEVVHDRV